VNRAFSLVGLRHNLLLILLEAGINSSVGTHNFESFENARMIVSV
jgi:hypothetical protein